MVIAMIPGGEMMYLAEDRKKSDDVVHLYEWSSSGYQMVTSGEDEEGSGDRKSKQIFSRLLGSSFTVSSSSRAARLISLMKKGEKCTRESVSENTLLRVVVAAGIVKLFTVFLVTL